ncbi:MAG: type II toxin-antitoxin system RelE/ParE family toxin [Methylocella sp.]
MDDTKTRPIAWIKAARKVFEEFPSGARQDLARALTVFAEGGHPDIAKPLTGFGSGVLELALKHRGDAFRVVYALQLGDDIWIVHVSRRNRKAGSARQKSKLT